MRLPTALECKSGSVCRGEGVVQQYRVHKSRHASRLEGWGSSGGGGGEEGLAKSRTKIERNAGPKYTENDMKLE